MFIELVLLSLTFVGYWFFYRPWSLMNYYEKVLKSLNYRVCRYPYSPQGAQLHSQMKKDEVKYKDAFYTVKHAQQYDVVLCNLIHRVWILIINPQILKSFYAPDKVDIYHKAKFLSGLIIQIAGKGIAFSQGGEWNRRRKVMSQAFSFEFVKNQIPTMLLTADQQMENIQKSEEFPNVFILKYLYGMNGNNTALSFFGQQVADVKIKGESMPLVIKNYIALGGEVGSTPEVLLLGNWIINTRLRKNWRLLLEVFGQYNRVMLKFIKQTREKIESSSQEKHHHNILAAILKYNKQCQKQQHKYTDKQILEDFNSVFGAGIGNSSTFILTMLYFLAIHPEIKKKVVEEIDQHIKSEQDYTYDNLKKLKYLDCVEKQNFRFSGPGNSVFLREATRDHLLKDIPVLKNTLVSVLQLTNGYNQKYYNDPQVFRPQRWITDVDKMNQRPALVGNHFSSGPRNCIGKQYGLLQVRVNLVRFLKRYDYQLENPELKFIFHFSYYPEETKIKLKKRQQKMNGK